MILLVSNNKDLTTGYGADSIWGYRIHLDRRCIWKKNRVYGVTEYFTCNGVEQPRRPRSGVNRTVQHIGKLGEL
jgi:hypothetical protein